MRGRDVSLVVVIVVALGLGLRGVQGPLPVQADELQGGHGAHHQTMGPMEHGEHMKEMEQHMEQMEEAEGEQPQGPVVGYDGKTPIKMSADHAAHQMGSGGVPEGWSFTIPVGDPKQGRRLFVKFECYKCHKVQGEKFPGKRSEIGVGGPDLTGMGGHAAEYLAESIVNPNAVLLKGEGFLGEDGLSKMPSYNDDLTLQQLVDLVAYIKTLVPKEASHAHDGHHQH